LILGIFQSPLSVRQQLFETSYIRVMHSGRSAQLAFTLGAFLGQDVTLVRLAPFDAAGCCHPEAFCRSTVGFQLGHFRSPMITTNSAGNALPAEVTFKSHPKRLLLSPDLSGIHCLAFWR
jgi:hypothetical protein